MTGRRLSDFIDALTAGRRPRGFRAEPEDAAVLRTAITLRGARPGDAIPNEDFVSSLYETLADQAASRLRPNIRPLKVRRARTALAAVAAGFVLVGGTVGVTEAFQPAAVTPAAVEAPHGQLLRTGTFETADNLVMGQIVAYGGHPSWVFMNIEGADYNGPITCMLQNADGSVVAVGNFKLHRGIGQFSRTIRVDIGGLRGAKLVSSTGSVLASATFA